MVVVGLVLFLIYINDLSNALENSLPFLQMTPHCVIESLFLSFSPLIWKWFDTGLMIGTSFNRGKS